ncbi:Efflux RND transporter permease subunit [Sulfidibacter corallicola]|uniref:Efflux RND transporter permease subunit n=1 Tax=Sulfidibacter corallicola TaxID=2818388 RepID=A0A8A4TVV2_SULCO|nr:efflux RND transporter permease subunit [Sulfidibacter corallicola]QTD53281.1 efflux RND transporter permease subunit [Sulfidibacter corallicola]
MIDFLLRRPVAVSMFYLAVVILGFLSFRNLSVEGQPDTEMPQLVVSTVWGASSPEVVQVFLTSPIEEAAAQVEGLEELYSSSTRGESTVTLKFNRDTDMEFARLDLNERLSQLRGNLPPGAQQPVISMVDTEDRGSGRMFMLCSISGPYDFQRLSEILKDQLRPELSSVEGVAELLVWGDREKNIRVSLDREAMDLYNLVPSIINQKIAALTDNYETSRSHLGNQEYSITIENSIRSLDELNNLVVAQSEERKVLLSDVAKLSIGQARPRSLSRLNGNPTLAVTIFKETGANVIETSDRVKQKVAEVLPTLPEGFRLDWVVDEGQMMKEQLDSVYQRALWCIGLIVILLLIFLRSVSAAMVITFNILFSVLITINFMYYFQVSFNVVTLSGLAIGFGMLVDNAIVVLENIFRHRELGKNKLDAAVEGVKEVGWALLAATLTTVAAFGCMLGLKDRLAVTYLPLALAVIFSLSASLLVSFSFTPLLSLLIRGSNLRREKRSEGGGRLQAMLSKPLLWLLSSYGKVVDLVLHHKLTVLVVTGCLMFLFTRIFFTEIDRGGFSFGFLRDDSVIVSIRMPEGAELETADDVIRQFEEPLLELEVGGYKDLSVRVDGVRAVMEVRFSSEMLASPYPLALKSRLIGIAQGFAGINVFVGGINADDNYYSGSTGYETYNSSIRLLGYNYKRLMDYSEKVLRTVRRNRRVKNTNIQTSRRSFGRRDQTESVIEVDRKALKHHAIDVSYLMGFISRNLRLESLTRTKYQGEEIILELKFEDADVFDIKALENLVITTEEGERIRLQDLVVLRERKVPGGIDRKDQQYAVTIQWDYKASYKKARRYNESVFSSLELPSGFSAELDYDRDLSQEETENLKWVLIVAAAIVFMIIATLYESFIDPLIIFSTIPLSFIGVSWIYWYTGNSFDSTAYIGLVILAGIVVNNSILLVSQLGLEVRRMDETGLTFNQAITKACQDRLRPILLTAITTIVGLLPLLDEFVVWLMDFPLIVWLIEMGGGSVAANEGAENAGLQATLKMFSSLSRSTVGGMISATLSTLFVIPVVYAIFFRGKQWLHVRINEVFRVLRADGEEA